MADAGREMLRKVKGREENMGPSHSSFANAKIPESVRYKSTVHVYNAMTNKDNTIVYVEPRIVLHLDF